MLTARTHVLEKQKKAKEINTKLKKTSYMLQDLKYIFTNPFQSEIEDIQIHISLPLRAHLQYTDVHIVIVKPLASQQSNCSDAGKASKTEVRSTKELCQELLTQR
jgi:hypothetical protein